MKTNPKLDLVLERNVDVAPELVWMAWTVPAHLMKWFTPHPWSTVECELDLRPGGVFNTVMQSPEGQKFPNFGCFLEIVPNRKLVWTNALVTDFRPAGPPSPNCPFSFTAMIEIEPSGAGTKYTATVLHHDEASRTQHAEMGFAEGWGAAVDQLVAHMKEVRASR